MPIYEYQCGACGNELEVLQKVSDALLTDCPACGAAALKKKVSAVAFRLKGGGWYETDFKTGNKKNLAGGESGEGVSASGAKEGEAAGKAKEGGAKKADGGDGGTAGTKDSKTQGKQGV